MISDLSQPTSVLSSAVGAAASTASVVIMAGVTPASGVLAGPRSAASGAIVAGGGGFFATFALILAGPLVGDRVAERPASDNRALNATVAGCRRFRETRQCALWHLRDSGERGHRRASTDPSVTHNNSYELIPLRFSEFASARKFSCWKSLISETIL